ncbi:MAG TPA: hypothetical protein PKX91_03105 [Clostridia bacterium]|jgi:CYTH domain-containing protein|nr:hypothetical protein [Clostridia bacterium]
MATFNTSGIEIERKFLIRYPDINLLEKIGAKTEIEQTYLASDDDIARRIRKTTERGVSAYFYCQKQDITPRKRTEEEVLITESKYYELLDEAITGTLKKTRYNIPFLEFNLEIDVYPFWDDRAILEIELSFENEEIQFPNYIEVIGEVTEELLYRNISLARMYVTP